MTNPNVPAVATATATAAAVSGIASYFMLDGATYGRGAELGFQGIDFYVAGRGGVLGDVDADVVAAALVFFNPGVVRAAWEGSRSVLPRAETALEFAGCASRWAESHLGDDVDWARLAVLAGKVVAGASVACAPIFAGWRALPLPEMPKAAALHQLNALRELRFARHGVAVVANGIDIADAVRHRSAGMAALFGWDGEVSDPAGVSEAWSAAEAMTDRLFGADLAALDADELTEFETLCPAAQASIT